MAEQTRQEQAGPETQARIRESFDRQGQTLIRVTR